ncbi:hypothetical protein Cgig2_034045 [Carnegiea gigantea]|uniref:ENTH domain-containing protein n=1 Tax=Carnegiea gigantea TaxID=171969 RepID=A0A9Q1QLU2_9CARY|nr:hypothetical protein Cgig2_034045 [Carnegiea gigantea]
MFIDQVCICACRKREVNKKVLKVPSIEQKVLDATSNEPWGPHGSLLADLAQASRNYHEYQMIMIVIWKRINDTGKNWRHVYKALTVLEYLVANGSERVIDEIREHAYQISTLSDFQYIDSSGRDQGNNVRRKSQSLVHLVNDKERIQEVRQKAASNRDKFRSTYAAGGMFRPGSRGYDDHYEGHYGGREDEWNGYGREREWGYKDDERYGRFGDSYNREGDRYGRDSDEHYGRDSYRDEDSRGRSQNVDDYQYGSRSRSSDRDGECAYDDDDRHSSRGSSARGRDHLQDGRPLERKFSEQNLGGPPSYEEAVGDSKTPTYDERDGETAAAPAPRSSSPAAGSALGSSSSAASTAIQSSPSSGGTNLSHATAEHGVLSDPSMGTEGFDEFDPRGSVAAPAAASTFKNPEMDLFGSLSDVFSPNPLAIMPLSSGTAGSEADATKTAPSSTFTGAISASNVSNRSLSDPFGDSPFKAITSEEPSAETQNYGSMPSFQPAVSATEHAEHALQKVETAANVTFTDAFPSSSFNPTDVHHAQTVPNSQYLPREAQSVLDNDILAGILPLSDSVSATTSQPSFSASPDMPPATTAQAAFSAPTGLLSAVGSQAAFPASTSRPPIAGLMPQSGPTVPSFPYMPAHNMVAPSVQRSHQNSISYSPKPLPLTLNVPQQAQTGSTGHQNNNFLGDPLPQAGPASLSLSKSAPLGLVGSLVHQQPAKEKFEPKSMVWADTLSRVALLLILSIICMLFAAKTNPLADIGVDFESLNRKEKRMEKSTAAPTTSNVSMGKAMGSGSGIGCAGAGVMRPPPNPMMGSGTGMSMGAGPSVGMGMVNYGSMNQQPMGMGLGRGGSMGMAMGMNVSGMNMGVGQGMPMQPTNGLVSGSNMGSYNPTMGRGGYTQQQYGGGHTQQQYGGGYR